jgi:hypothetical protein
MIGVSPSHIKVPLQGRVNTNSQGIRCLLNWYYQASQHHNAMIETCCGNLEWIDANLAALWSALIHKLSAENSCKCFADENELKGRFSILFRNGFARAEPIEPTVKAKTFIPNASFGPSEDAAFSSYIESELLAHQQVAKLSPLLRGLLESNLQELYQNVFRHAGTTEPFFVCGQYYPGQHEIIVSMVDLGQTFLPGIHKATEGKICTQEQAISWALNGNSALGKKGGGLGLKCIHDFFKEAGHCMQIATGAHSGIRETK